ncbi:MAG: EutN/CcmL family microcompartment protein [Bdellovibrionota bacterium]
MILARVVESLVASQKHPALQGHALFYVQPILANGTASGEAFVALNSVDAGPGDVVLVCNEGTGCRQIFDAGIFPVNHVIAGFVDQIERV